MASNNALEFKIKFVEDYTSLNKAIENIKQKLEGTSVKLTVGEIDITKITNQLTTLQGSVQAAQEMFDKMGNTSSFQSLADEIKRAARSMQELSDTLSSNLGTNIGNAIVNGLAQANQAIATTMANLEKMNELASNKELPKDLNQKVNLDLALTKLAEIEKYMTAIGKQQEASSHLGFDLGKIDAYQGRLNLVKASLEEIKNKEGEGTRVDTILRNAHYGELIKGLTNELKAVNEVSVAIDRVKASLESLNNVKGFDKLKGDLREVLDALQKPGASKMLQSEQVNRHLTSLYDQTKEAVKANTQAEREQQQEQNRTAQETAKAQNIIQREIDKTRQKFYELYEAQARLREKSFFSGVDASGPLGETQRRLTALVSQMRQMETMMKASPQQMTAFAQSDSLKTWRRDFEAGMKIAREEIKSITDSLKIDNLLGNLSARFSELLRLGRNAANLGFNNLAHDAYDAAANLRQVSKELEQIQKTGLSSKGLSFSEYMRTGEFSKVISESSKARRDVDRSLRQAQQATMKQNRTEATNEINRLKKAMQEINAIQAKSPGIKINGVEKALQDIQRIINLLEQAKERGRDINLIKGVMGDYSAQNMNQTLAALSHNQQQAAQQAAQHTHEQQRMAQAINQATGEARQQSQALSDLRSMAAQYISVWGAANFVKEVAQITGELELQQKSLEVIIGSAGKAQELYNDIKGMSQMSPFTFQNLVKTTKQLAAFGVETKDVFDTMKMLSNVGAGLDVDVQRLVLAYGHIKSAGVLSGIQRRQLETAGVGITRELANLYNQQYRQAGSDERVTAEDVFKRIKDRQVTFEDVEKVFQRLTGPGGKFENMQLKQYETLGGKLRNLQNNYNIMLDEIGRAHMELLMGGVNTLNSLMENWKKWADIIKAVGAGLVAAKVAQLALGKGAAAHGASVMMQRRMRMEQEAIYLANGQAPPAQQGALLNKANYAAQINASNMTRFQKINAALYKDVSNNAKQAILSQQGLNAQYINSVKTMGTMRLAMERLRWSANGFFATMRAGFAALMTNPMTWIFVAIAAITSLVSRYKELNRVASEMREKMVERESDDIRGITETLSTLPETIHRDAYASEEGLGRMIVDKDSIPDAEVETLVETLDEALQKYDPLYKGHLFDIEQMEDEKEKVAAMMEDLDAARIGKEVAKGKSAMLSKGIADTGGLVLEDTFLEELKEYQDAYIDQQAQIEELVSKWENEKIPLVLKYYDHELSQEQIIDLEKMIKDYYNVTELTGDMIREYMTSRMNTKDFEGWIEGAEMRLDNSDLRSKITALSRKYFEGVSPAVMAGLKEAQKKDPTGKAGAAYIQEMLNQILNTEGFEIKDEKTRKAVSEAIVLALNESFMRENPEAAVAIQNGPIQEYLTQMVNAQADEFLALEKAKYGDIDKMDQEVLKKDYAAYFESLASEMKALTDEASGGEEYLKRYITAVKATWKALKGGGNVEISLKPWQEKIKEALNLQKFDDVKVKLGLEVGVKANLQEFIKECQEKYKKYKETALSLAQDLNIRTKFGIKIDLDAAFGSAAGLKKLRDELRKKVYPIYYGGAGDDYYHDPERAKAQKEIRETLKPLLDLVEKMVSIADMGSATGYDMAGYNKEKGSGKKKESPSKKSGENAADKADREEMDRIRKKIKLIQDLNKAYKQYRDLGYGELAALQKVQADYEAEYEKGKRPFEFGDFFKDIKSIEDYSALLDKVRKEDLENSKKLSAKSKDELNREIMNARREILNAGLRERSEKLLNDLNGELEQLSDQFSILRKIVESTGDRMEAVDMAGVGRTGRENYSDLVRAYLDNELKQMETELNAKAQELEIGPISLEDLDYNKIAKMDSKGIENYIKEVYGVDPTVDWVKGISEWAKAYRKAIRDENKAAAEAYAKAIAEDLEYEAQKRRIETSLEDEIAKIQASDASDESKARAIGIATAKSDLKIMELQNQYKRFFDGIFAEPLDSMDAFAKEISENYMDAMIKGAMTADEYAKKIMEINDVMEKAKAESNKGWFEKGIFNTKTQEDITKKMLEEAQDKMNEANEMMQQAASSGNLADGMEGAMLWKEGHDLMTKANKRAKLLRDINGAVTTVDNVVQSMNKAFNYIYEAFDSIGEGDALASLKDYMETLSTVSGHVKGAMESFMKGDMLGTLTEGIGSVFSLITGLSQAHDNRLQRKIEEIQFDTSKMSNTLDTIKSLRERQLGYDNGNMRLVLAAMYSQNGRGGSDAATRAMIDYYTRFGGGSGYEQELKLLEEQRQKLLEIYNLEESKKKSSKEDLEDYKKQIADLDEQIHFFAEDLAKELWGIDIKGWADQLGDALMTAFENGSSAAAAFKDTVQDIMRGVVKSMLVTGVIEPAMQNLYNKLFGKDGNGGLLDINNPKGSMGAVLAELGNWFNTQGPALMDAANEFYSGADNMMRQILGYGMRTNESSSNTVNSIQSAASEETMGIVAGYLSRLSQDVSVQRIMQEMFVNGSWPDYIEQVTTANNSLTAIDRSTTAMMEMMRDGNGALYERVENMSRRLDNFANGIDRISVN